MANSVVTQVIIDGPRNAIVKITGVLDTSDVAVQTAIAMSSLNQSNTGPTPDQCRIDEIEYSVSDQLVVILEWHATTNVVIAPLAGRGEFEAKEFGGLQNNAGAGKNGTIDIRTTGYASNTQTFTILLYLVKQGVNL